VPGSRDGYVVFEEEMRIVGRIFKMVSIEGYGIRTSSSMRVKPRSPFALSISPSLLAYQ
jgi:hypothetical protein